MRENGLIITHVVRKISLIILDHFKQENLDRAVLSNVISMRYRLLNPYINHLVLFATLLPCFAKVTLSISCRFYRFNFTARQLSRWPMLVTISTREHPLTLEQLLIPHRNFLDLQRCAFEALNDILQNTRLKACTYIRACLSFEIAC